MVFHKFKSHSYLYGKSLLASFKWILLALLTGAILGCIGSAFYECMKWATSTRLSHPWMIFLLPAGGLAIVGLYHLFHDDKDTGTNLVISAIHSDNKLPPQMAPLIFVSTIITHLFGGSAGREGAALQMGGSIGSSLASLFHFNENDQKIMIMCGMSASFSAIFGTPLAASVFSIEVISVGIMQYAALVPCVISALTARRIAFLLTGAVSSYSVPSVPSFSVLPAVKFGVLALLCAAVSMLFCILLHQTEHAYKKLFKNQYLRVIIGGCCVIAATLLTGSQTYNGAGLETIALSFTQPAPFYSFLLKMIFTALTLGAGYKGGEIVPSLFIGAVFGSFMSQVLGLPVAICAAVGMGSVFCGVTNCPITSLLICFELFGFRGMPYYMLAIALSYMLSGYYGLYSSQKFAYSKYRTDYINKSAE